MAHSIWKDDLSVQAPETFHKDEYHLRGVGVYENWQNLLDIANAIRYGFSNCRLPKPGAALDVTASEERVAHIEDEWAKEWKKRVPPEDKTFSPAPDLNGLSTEAKCYLDSVLYSIDSRWE